jgi:hypothetical protein
VNLADAETWKIDRLAMTYCRFQGKNLEEQVGSSVAANWQDPAKWLQWTLAELSMPLA